MKKKILEEIIIKKTKKNEFAIITNLNNGESCIFEKNKKVNSNFKKYEKEINLYFDNKKNGIIENTDIFIDNYIRLVPNPSRIHYKTFNFIGKNISLV